MAPPPKTATRARMALDEAVGTGHGAVAHNRTARTHDTHIIIEIDAVLFSEIAKLLRHVQQLIVELWMTGRVRKPIAAHNRNC